MRYNLNKGSETRDEFETFLKSALAMELISLEATTASQLKFARLENWRQETIDELDWQLEAIKSEINLRFHIRYGGPESDGS